MLQSRHVLPPSNESGRPVRVDHALLLGRRGCRRGGSRRLLRGLLCRLSRRRQLLAVPVLHLAEDLVPIGQLGLDLAVAPLTASRSSCCDTAIAARITGHTSPINKRNHPGTDDLVYDASPLRYRSKWLLTWSLSALFYSTAIRAGDSIQPTESGLPISWLRYGFTHVCRP